MRINARSQGGVLDIGAAALSPVGQLSENPLYISASSLNAFDYSPYLFYHLRAPMSRKVEKYFSFLLYPPKNALTIR